MSNEEVIIRDLITMFAEQIGLILENNDIDDIHKIYENKKHSNNDIQLILFEALFSLQELRVEHKNRKSSLVVI